MTWTVTDIHGNVTDTAKQTVRVIDNTIPVVITKPITIQLVNGTASISVADINNGSSDACGISSYVLSKSNFGCSDIGNNTVTLTVTDIHGNSNTGTATVTVVGSIPVASIQVTPAEATYTGGNPRIIYLGYGAQSVSLQATATGASGYTYSWSGNGSLSQTNGSTVVFAPTSAGTYQFTVLVNSNSGCTATASVSIQVVDVRVPGSGGKKVYVCHDGSTIAISTNAVDAHLRNHATDKLGSCGQTNGNAAMISQIQLNAEAKDALSVQVLPNPSRSHFTLKLQSTVNAPVQLRITDASGRAVESRQHLSANSTVQVGHQLISGTYYAEFTQGSNRKVVQLIKIK
ncbi:MAG: T9SS type A sorting domain-containing protein [Chitinophagaceae bacterium]|nr:T9SS type A sorting domain-containing protein [Chitinophagaceae bacterium]